MSVEWALTVVRDACARSFNGHFPARPIMPGVLQVEAMAQVGGMVCLQEPVTDGNGDFFFAGVNNIKWRRPVVPGDTLVMEMEMVAFKRKFGIVKMKGKPAPRTRCAAARTVPPWGTPTEAPGSRMHESLSTCALGPNAANAMRLAPPPPAGVAYVDGNKVVEGDFQFAMVVAK